MDTVEKPASLQGFVDRWLDAQPSQHVALLFVDGRRYPGHLALAAFEQEMLDAAYGAREPQVVAAKLTWWISELTEAPTTGGQHPLTQVLFGEDRALAIPASVWTEPVRAAIAQLEHGTAADFAGQLTAVHALHAALAALETRWWYGAAADPAKAARIGALNHLLHALRRLPQDVDRDCLPLPMARLAEHGLGREALHEASDARTRAIRAELRDLAQALGRVGRERGPLSVFRAVEWREALRLARRALGARDPLAALAAGGVRPGVFSTLHAWRAAMRWQRADLALPAPVATSHVAPG